MLKRVFDILVSSLALVVLFPAFLVFPILIKLDSPGPVFYRGVRVGRYRRLFRIFKFRSMVVNADRIGGFSTANDDPRITKVGQFLRKYKLDELPQLINVLIGDMSFVGPRPEVQQYVDLYTDEEKLILTVRPGISDWATLWNPDEGAVLAGSPNSEKTYLEKIRPEKIRLQMEYVRKRSFLVDLSIIVQTVASVVCRTKPRAMSVVNQKG